MICPQCLTSGADTSVVAKNVTLYIAYDSQRSLGITYSTRSRREDGTRCNEDRIDSLLSCDSVFGCANAQYMCLQTSTCSLFTC